MPISLYILPRRIFCYTLLHGPHAANSTRQPAAVVICWLTDYTEPPNGCFCEKWSSRRRSVRVIRIQFRINCIRNHSFFSVRFRPLNSRALRLCCRFQKVNFELEARTTATMHSTTHVTDNGQCWNMVFAAKPRATAAWHTKTIDEHRKSLSNWKRRRSKKKMGEIHQTEKWPTNASLWRKIANDLVRFAKLDIFFLHGNISQRNTYIPAMCGSNGTRHPFERLIRWLCESAIAPTGNPSIRSSLSTGQPHQHHT